MEEITPTQEMILAAKTLKTGEILIVYRDGGAIRMETEDGDDPYVWRNGQWKKMPLTQW